MQMIVTELAKEDISRLDHAGTFGPFYTLFARIHQDIYNRGIIVSNVDIGMPRVANNNGSAKEKHKAVKIAATTSGRSNISNDTVSQANKKIRNDEY